MGRTKLPSKVKDLRGTKRKHREVDESAYDSTSVVNIEDVNALPHLNAVAKKVYQEVVQQLFAMQMLQPIDQHALCIFSNAIATAHSMQKALDKEGYVVETFDKDGNPSGMAVNPKQKVLKDALNMANIIGTQFGWSPSARIKLLAMLNKKKEDNDDFNQLING